MFVKVLLCMGVEKVNTMKIACRKVCHKFVAVNLETLWEPASNGGDRSVTAGKKKPPKRSVYGGFECNIGAQKRKRANC